MKNNKNSNNKKIPVYLRNARAIKLWIEENGRTKTPSQTAKGKLERRLGMALNSIRRNRVKIFLELDTDEKREEYRRKYPEIDEILAIVTEIDNTIERIRKNKQEEYINAARDIQNWKEKNNKWPYINGKDEEERRLAKDLENIRIRRVRPYFNLETEEEKQEFRQKYPETEVILNILGIKPKSEKISPHLFNAIKIKEWMEENGENRRPSQTAKDEEERRLGNALSSIRYGVIKPYLEFKTEEEKEEHRQKYPDIDKIIEIVQEIDAKTVPPLVRNAIEIKKWVEKNEDNKKPYILSDDPEEKKLAIALNNIKVYRIKPFMELKTEEEKRAYIEQYPETERIITLLGPILKINECVYLNNARDIKKWIEKRGKDKLPSFSSEDSEERRYYILLTNIRHYKMKPFLQLETEAEREAYRKKHPEIDEIIAIVNEIDLKCGRKTLEQKIKQNAEKRAKLQAAKKLESEYEILLSKQSNIDKTQTENLGVDIDDK